MLVVSVVDFALHYAAVARILPRLRLPRMAWKPLAACTAVYLGAVRPNGVVALVSATAVYAAVLVGIATVSAGGLRELKARYVFVRPD